MTSRHGGHGAPEVDGIRANQLQFDRAEYTYSLNAAVIPAVMDRTYGWRVQDSEY